MTPPTCARHPVSAAAVRCATCTKSWCTGCTTRSLRGVTLSVCPICDGRGRLEAVRPPERAGDFVRALGTVWRYPLQGSGWVVLLSGALLYTVLLWIIGFGGWVVPFAALSVGGFALGYLWVFLLSIVTSTADGADELPDWPDASRFYEIAAPLGRFALAVALCTLPALAAWLLLDASALVFMVLLVLGLFYLPICIIALAIGGTARDLNPVVLLPAAVRCGPAYLAACGALLLVLLARSFAERALGDVPLLGGAFGGLLGTYFLAVQMRILGLLYRTHERRIGLV